ncbi:hypothetical protein Ahy_A08g037948 [Arachis hypogaea]|uniref:C3H1-type domain-containing protein n=1 Tax=Arachis hypogaea TaxID=3818 RepID=A0A445BS79_ARAHY|nr:hypothetical protein Ahy_A08g037948 [Arachis hypogaea]
MEKKKDKSSGRVQQQYPLKPDAEDCAFYLKTGTCKFGFNCKFNHPLGRRKNQDFNGTRTTLGRKLRFATSASRCWLQHGMRGARSLLHLLIVHRKGLQDNYGSRS